MIRRLRWLAVALVMGLVALLEFVGEAVMAVFNDDVDFDKPRSPIADNPPTDEHHP